jgi:hypothetical protein
MTHLIGTTTETACGLTRVTYGDRVSCKRQLASCSACLMHIADFEQALQALAPRAFRVAQGTSPPGKGGA